MNIFKIYQAVIDIKKDMIENPNNWTENKFNIYKEKEFPDEADTIVFAGEGKYFLRIESPQYIKLNLMSKIYLWSAIKQWESIVGIAFGHPLSPFR
jgi:hypothetical protein